MTTIDRLDAEILAKMTRAARVGIAELATSLGVSRNTIQARIHRLEEAQILVGFRPIVNLAAIGMPVGAGEPRHRPAQDDEHHRRARSVAAGS
jgi:DNA-binding Lrp family transcriptional regulator